MMRLFYTIFGLVLLFYQMAAYPYPKISSIKSNPDYLLITDNSLPIIDITININLGSRHDGNLPGLMNLTFESISKLKYEDEKIVDLFESMGARFNYNVGKDFSSITVRFINNQENIIFISKLLNYILTERRLEEKDLDFLKEKIKNTIYSQSLSPGPLASIKLDEKFFAGTGYSHPIVGYQETINSIKTNNIIDQLNRAFNKSLIDINIVGNISENESAHMISKLLRNLPKGEKINYKPTEIKFNGKMFLNKVSMDTKQTHILIFTPAVSRTDEQYYSFLVINYLFGGSGFGSKLFSEIRQKRGLAYSVYSYLRPYKDFGILAINMQTKNENAREAIKILKDEIYKLKNNNFDSEEISKAKNSILNNFYIRYDTNRKMLGLLSQINYLNLNLDYFNVYVNSINSVSNESISKILEKELFIEKSIITAVGNF